MKRKKRNICGYWDCNKPGLNDHFLCAEHRKDWEDGIIDRCPKCARFKDVMYELCLDCYFDRPVAQWDPPTEIPARERSYRIEFSEAWTDGSGMTSRVFVYILKLADGALHIGHTTNIRKRFAEHKEGKVISTAGRNPRLQYLEIVATEKSAESRSDELKKLVDTNPGQIQLMINQFQTRMAEFDLE